MCSPLQYNTEFHHPKKKKKSTELYLFNSPPTVTKHQTTTYLFIISVVLLFSECHINRTWVYSVTMLAFTKQSLIHILALLNGSFLFIVEWYSIVGYITVYSSIYLVKDRLVASIFWQLRVMLLSIIVYRVFLDIKFQITWINMWECNCWVIQ